MEDDRTYRSRCNELLNGANKKISDYQYQFREIERKLHLVLAERDKFREDLRDRFAGQALMGLLAHNCEHFTGVDLEAPGVSARAYATADAMLEARKSPPK